VVLLRSAHASYGVASLAFLGVSLVVQVVLVKTEGKKPWLSKDVATPDCHLSRPSTRSVPSVRRRATKATGCRLRRPSSQYAFKGTEVTVETLPAVVLQLMLLNASPDNWTSPELLISLAISITAAAVLMVDADISIIERAGTRRRYMDYHGYLPLKGGRRAVLLASLAFFMAGYLVQAASSIAVALELFPLWAVFMVLLADWRVPCS
jgi:hypothetical protein